MISGSILVYYGQELVNIPSNTYLKINKSTSTKALVKNLLNLTVHEKDEYRKNIFNFLISINADQYRYDFMQKRLLKNY